VYVGTPPGDYIASYVGTAYCFDVNAYIRLSVHVKVSSVSVGALTAICMQSATLMTSGKPFFVLQVCLRQLHGLPKYFLNFFLRTFENYELSQV